MPFNFVRRVLLILIAMCQLAQAAVTVGDYQLGSGDLLHVNVFDHPELSLDVRIGQSGTVSYPLVGVLQFGGLSTRDAELLLARRLNDGGFVLRPQVSIIVTDFQSQKVGVVGQVNKPGQYALTATQRVLDVLSMAGGVLADSSADQASLMRKDGSVQTIDLRKLLGGDLSANLIVQNGDTLSVPRAPEFYIYGQVQRPGVYRLGRDTTVSQAISMGGGLTRQGTERGTIVKRRDANGVEKQYRIKPKDAIQPNDVILIKESLF
jgi:polysaccharide biosynthesis/export protein